jgi:hypothetical protein
MSGLVLSYRIKRKISSFIKAPCKGRLLQNEKQPSTSPSDESFQTPAETLLPLTVPEVRHSLWYLAGSAKTDRFQILHGSVSCEPLTYVYKTFQNINILGWPPIYYIKNISIITLRGIL